MRMVMSKPKPRAAAFLACLATAVGAPFACGEADKCAGPEGLCVAPPNASAGASATDASATSETGAAVMGGDSAGAPGNPSVGEAGASTGLDGSSGAPNIVFPGDGFGIDAGALVPPTICSGGDLLADPPRQCPLGAGDVACESDADCTTRSAPACPALGEVTGVSSCTAGIYGVNKTSTSACGAPSCPVCSGLVLTQDCRISGVGVSQISVSCVAGQCKSFTMTVAPPATDAGTAGSSSQVDAGTPPVCALLSVVVPGEPPLAPTKAGGSCPSGVVACDVDTDCTTLTFNEEPCGCAHAIVGVNQSAGPGCVLPACPPASDCGPADTFQSQDCAVTSEPAADIGVRCVSHQCLTYVSKATPPPAWTTTTCIAPALFTDTCPADAGLGDPDFCGSAAPPDAASDSESSDPGDSGGGGGHSGNTDAGKPPTLFLIDDFEDGDAVSQFVLGGRGAWYTAADTSTGLIFPSPSSSLCFVSSLLIPTDPTGGRALHAYGTALSGYGQAGISLRTGAPTCDEAMDASTMTGVRFRARATPGSTTGTAWMRVSIGTAATNPVADSGTCVGTCYDAFGSYVTLTEQWSEYFVPFANVKQQGWGTPATFDPSKLLSIIWDPEADLLETQASCFDFWIDDVAFYQAQ
jgi:hypothetical protein